MCSLNFAKSAILAVFRWLAIKVCKFFLKKISRQLILGDTDLNELDVQFRNVTFQLSDLALNVEFLINQKFGEAAILVAKEGSIGSLTVRLPWIGRNCEIEVEELEFVLFPGMKRNFQVGNENEPSTSGQDGNSNPSHGYVTPEQMVDSTIRTDIHKGGKTIAKIVLWWFKRLHVKIKKLIIALEPFSEEPKEKGPLRTLVLRFGEVECGIEISEDGNLDGFLRQGRLSNFVKFDGAVLEFLQLDNESTLSESFSGCCSLNATTTVITGEKGGFSGTVELSIPWKNGSLDIRKLDADVHIDPLELRLQPSSLKNFMHFVHVFEEHDKDHKSFTDSKTIKSASSHGYSSTEFSSNNFSQKPETYTSTVKDTVLDALSHLISDWMTLPVSNNRYPKTNDPDFGASVDRFFESSDELRTSQSTLGNSGIWNWTCSVFSAISAASNLHIPSEQKHVETSLKARITKLVILFSFLDEDQNPSYVHYITADFHEMKLVLQVCPQDSNFEATVQHIEVADHSSTDEKEKSLLIRKKQAAVEGACPPLGFLVQGDTHSSTQKRYHRGIYSGDVAKVSLLRTSGVTQCQYITPFSSQDIKSQPTSLSVKLPPLILWVNFHLLSTMLDFIKEIENSIGLSDVKSFTKMETNRNNVRSCFWIEWKRDKVSSEREIAHPLRFNISIMDARMVLCFPCEKSREDYTTYLSWNNFIVIDLSSPKASHPPPSVPKQRFHITPSRFLHLNVGNIAVYFVESTSECFSGKRVLWVYGHPSVFSFIWQDNAITGPWITKKANILSTSDDLHSQTQEDMVLTSSFFLLAHLSPVTININNRLYQNIHDLLHQVSDWVSCISSPNQVASSSQSSIFLECNVVEISLGFPELENEIPGSWCNLKLKVWKFELLNVSNTGGVSGANFIWVAHGEGDLSGFTTGVSDKNIVLISCDESTRGRGNGEGSNILSSRFPGSDIIHLWDPEKSFSQVSINIRCATIVALGGRLEWFDAIMSFFRTENDQDFKNYTSCGSSFVLNLIDIGLRYEPYNVNAKTSEQCVAGLLAASSLKLSNISSSNSVEKIYEIKGHDLGLLLREESVVKNVDGSYKNLRKNGYIKVAEGTDTEAVLRTNCDNGHEWELECSESHIVVETCHDSTSGLARLSAQIQQIFAPDVEESIVHLQTRWDNLQESYHSTSSSLMDEISQGAFNMDKHHKFLPLPDNNGPDFIDGYFVSDMHPKGSLNGKTESLKETEDQDGWYRDSILKIVEDHVLVKTNSKQGCRKVKGRVVLKNIDVRWTLYGGSDWQCTTNISTRNKAVALEFILSKMGFQYDVFPDGEICVSKLSLLVQDFSLNDVSNGAPWIQVLGCYQSKDCPRESCSRALKLELESVRPHPSIPLEEYRLQIGVLPMRLHLHQIQLEFLISFFGGNSSYSQDIVELDMPHNLGSHSITEEALLPYFQKFSMLPVVIRVDYIPSRVDLPALGYGKYIELVNLFQWKGVELQLKHVEAVGVYGWSSVCDTIIGEWLEDISQNQVHKLLKGLPPICSLVAIGSSAAKLVSLPMKSYKKDGKLVKGMQRGTIALLRSVSLEAIGLGAHLAAGAHAILLQAEDIISTTPPTSVPYGRSSQPKDARQGIQQAFETISDGIGRSASVLVHTPLKKYQRGAGVGLALSTAVQAAPGAAIAPASAAARAMHSALLGVRNSLDPEHKKDSMDNT